MEKNSSITVNVTPGIVFKGIMLLILFYVLYLIRDIVLVVLTAIVVASAIEPFTKGLAKYRIRRLPAVILIYAVVIGILLSFFYFFIPPFLSDMSNFLASVPQYLNTLSVWNPVPGSDIFDPERIVHGIAENVSLKQAIEQIANFFSGASGGVFRTVSFVFGGALSFILIIVLSFYLAVQEDGIAKFLRIVTPLRHEAYIIDLWKRSQIKIGRWMQGQLILGVVVGVLVFLGLTLLSIALPGITNIFIFAVLAFLFELIPLFGPILAAIPPIILAFTTGSVTAGLTVTGLYLLIHQFENHLIYPMVVRKIVGVPPILVILALIIGVKLGGFLGIILSVPIAAVLVEYIDDVQRFKTDKRDAQVIL